MTTGNTEQQIDQGFSEKLKIGCGVFALLAFIMSWMLSNMFGVAYDKVLSSFVFCGGIGLLFILKAARGEE